MNGEPPAPAPLDPAQARFARHREARKAGDDDAILAASREAAVAASRDALAQGRGFIREAYGKLPDDPTPAEVIDAEADALRKMSWTARAALLANGEAEAGGSSIRPLSDWIHAKDPDPVIWRHAGNERWPLASVGEPAILSAPGGSGKSYLTLSVAIAATRAHAAEESDADALGFGVKPGPVILAAYEDSPERLAGRVKRVTGDDSIPAHLHILADPDPLFYGDPDSHRGQALPGAAWGTLWQAAQALRPSLIVIDPASEALADISASEAGPVRTFLRSLARESAAIKAGVLIVAHDTKAARNEARAGGDPGAGAVAGSSAWFDRARGVAYMHTDPVFPAGRIVEVIKANHGRARWGVTLTPAYGGQFGDFRGWQHSGDIEPDDMAATLKPPKDDAKGKGAKRSSKGAAGFNEPPP